MGITFTLVHTVYATAADPKKGSPGTIAPIAIGLIVEPGILAARPCSGSSMNPARSFGPETSLTTGSTGREWWADWPDLYLRVVHVPRLHSPIRILSPAFCVLGRSCPLFSWCCLSCDSGWGIEQLRTLSLSLFFFVSFIVDFFVEWSTLWSYWWTWYLLDDVGWPMRGDHRHGSYQ